MSLPSEHFESLYRNSIKDVASFLDEKHQNNYRVYNLCSERKYNKKWFHNNVKTFPIRDHNVPTVSMMHQFAIDAFVYLIKNPNHVIAVHCKVYYK